MTVVRTITSRPRLSIVIPAADSAALEDTLVSVLENRPADAEIVVIPALPYDDPWNIAEEVRFIPAPVGAGLVGCVNVGVAASVGSVIHVLAGGWKATEGWTDRALERFEDRGVGAVVPLGVSAVDRDQVVCTGIRRTLGGRSRLLAPARRAAPLPRPSAPALEAGFWRADVLTRAAGFSTACGDANAAADMAALLACAGLEVVVEPSSRIVWGPARRRGSAFLAGLHAERLFWRSLAADSIVPALVAHAVEIVRHAAARAPLGTLPMLAGRLAALVQFGSSMPRARLLREAQRQATTASKDAAPRTLRIDAPHAFPAGPHVVPEATPLKRSA
jgi:hypothetical protein